jgi:phage shock protein A
MVKKAKKEMTIDQLARMVQGQFVDIHKEFARVHEIHKVFADQFDHIQSDIRDIKTTLGPLVRIAAEQDKEIRDLEGRLHRVERKIGIK